MGSRGRNKESNFICFNINKGNSYEMRIPDYGQSQFMINGCKLKFE